MYNRYDDRSYNRRRAPVRRRKTPAVPVLLGTAAVVVLALIIALSGRGPAADPAVTTSVNIAANIAPTQQAQQQPAQAQPTHQNVFLQPTQNFVETPVATVAAEITPAPTLAGNYVDPYLMVRPVASTGFMPVFRQANYITDKIVAITVDDCNQVSNTRQIIDLALNAGGKITLFPIGENTLKEKLQDTIRYAYENGIQIENHTYSHNGLYGDTDQELAEHIYLADAALDHVLGLDYQMNFLRPRGGDNRNDQRTQNYISQLGYKGIAHWNQSGSDSVSKLLKNVAPGNIYLFHTTDEDLTKLKEFIPALVDMGYELVTLNEMFGYPPNEVKPLTKSAEELKQVPPLLPYDEVLVDLEQGDYLYAVKKLQMRLIDLGWLNGTADGVYGKGTYSAVGYFQQAVGIKPTGNADVATQEALYAEDAPAKTT